MFEVGFFLTCGALGWTAPAVLGRNGRATALGMCGILLGLGLMLV